MTIFKAVKMSQDGYRARRKQQPFYPAGRLPALISQQTYKFREKQHPRCTMQKEVKPVQRTDQPALKQHLQLFPYMRGIERSQSQGQTGYNEDGKWYFIKEIQQFVS